MSPIPTRTLVIEDNATNLELIAYLLWAFGHEVIHAADGEAGLEIAHREVPDLIVCDVHLPGINGYEVVRQLKANPSLSAIPAIAVTAFAMVGDRDRMLGAGFDGYIAKPINPETFVGDLEAFLQPAQKSTGEPPAPTDVASSLPQQATILVVDNVSVNLDLARSILEPFGHRVIVAGNVRHALALARQARPDLILADVHMPGESGYDLLKAVNADPQLQSIAFAFLTSTAWMEIDMATGLALGAIDFITRPIDPPEFLARVEACLRRRDAD